MGYSLRSFGDIDPKQSDQGALVAQVGPHQEHRERWRDGTGLRKATQGRCAWA